jgi:glycosyltransferase involved in cell wall biosynthesis
MIGEASLARRPGVPAHDRFVFADKRHKYAVAVFCINEGERVRAQLARMAPLADLADIIVADGGSTDASLDRRTLGDFHLRALLVKKDTGRLSAQMRMAMAYVIEEGYAGLVVIDGNGKDDVSAIPRFLELLEEGYDHVQGSRYIRGGKGVNTPVARHIGVKLLHAPLVSAAAHRRYTDTTNGFRAYSRKLLTDMRVSPLRDAFLGYELHYYLAIRAARLGFRIVETPVTRAYPKDGAIPTKITGMRGNIEVLKTLASVMRGEFDPDRRPSSDDDDDRSTGEWAASRTDT